MKTIIKAEIVAHSINEQGDELISVLATFPRIILAEVNTHRMLSKNTSSSRAIPFNKMVDTIKEDSFIPIAWQKAHSGMQGTEYFDNHFSITGNYNLDTNYGFWMDARDEAVRYPECLDSEGLTKQLANRLLEPFMWTTMLITGPKSGWDNFFNLRCPSYTFHTDESEKDFVFRSKKDVITNFGESEWVEDGFDKPLKDFTSLDWLKVNYGQAEIHMMALAECIWDAYNESTPKQLKAGEWHIPFGDKMDISSEEYINITGKIILKTKDLIKIKVKSSVAMAARTSYTIVGEEKALDYEALVGLHDRLLAQDPPHSSPLEHCARAMNPLEHETYIKGVIELIDLAEPEYNGGIYEPKFSEKGWCNNFKGFIPYRYLVDNKVSV